MHDVSSDFLHEAARIAPNTSKPFARETIISAASPLWPTPAPRQSRGPLHSAVGSTDLYLPCFGI
jgi:hypothetical protein